MKNSKVYDKFQFFKNIKTLGEKSTFLAAFVYQHYRWNKNFLVAIIENHLINYPVPINLNYAWSFGSLAGACLLIQMISGIFLAMHYTPNIDLAFSSVEHIMRDVPNGWLIRYIHSNGASMFFFVIYGHIIKALYYGSYMHPRQLLWCSGVVLYVLLMATAFLGYVLPWGQMSFWGATVITNMVTAVPYVGKQIVHWIWGGFTINNATLIRFYVAHFVLPFIISGVVLIHLALLHRDGSNNPLGVDSGIDRIPFYPYYALKDMHAFCWFLFIFGIFVFYYPNVLNHPNNYIPADPMHTPSHIVPEWYFLPFYAMLRSIPHKAGGIITMLFSILIWFLAPFINTSEVRSTTFRPIFKFFFWILMADLFLLGWIGQKPITKTTILMGQVTTVYYYVFFLVVIPTVGILESRLARFKTKNKKVTKNI